MLLNNKGRGCKHLLQVSYVNNQPKKLFGSKTIFKVGHLALLIKKHQHFHIPRQSFNILVRKEAPLEFLIHVKSFLFYARWKSTEEKQQFINELCLKYHPSFTFYTQCCFPSKMVSRVSIYALVPQSLPWGFYILKAILFEYKSLLRRIFWTISKFLFIPFLLKNSRMILPWNLISWRKCIKNLSSC